MWRRRRWEKTVSRRGRKVEEPRKESDAKERRARVLGREARETVRAGRRGSVLEHEEARVREDKKSDAIWLRRARVSTRKIVDELENAYRS